MNNGPTSTIKEIAGTLEKRRDRTLPYDRNTWTIQMYVWEPVDRVVPYKPFRFKESSYPDRIPGFLWVTCVSA